jgi:hypothetical protein
VKGQGQCARVGRKEYFQTGLFFFIKPKEAKQEEKKDQAVGGLAGLVVRPQLFS